ncbi:hypothetical protein CFN79_13855 [Chromobacterium vaccinii]|uniref:hypothetical protein n=1 Tax=Chromobacterium vaccinii TaxID=1108595 RepID=UPI000CE9AAEE|nr:hypothetical protein [Chromobacterium vaccinii]AVG16848.1 hypothetical protein CFN79_13855 [Chromobacterium vaccinii]
MMPKRRLAVAADRRQPLIGAAIRDCAEKASSRHPTPSAAMPNSKARRASGLAFGLDVLLGGLAGQFRR